MSALAFSGGLTRRTIIASGLLALVVGAAFVVLLLSIIDLRGAERRAMASQEVLVVANGLERRIVDLETSERGFVISGRWPFSSAVDNSDWNMLAVTVYDGDKAVDWRLCMVPKSDYEIIDTWHAMGMAGTGSKDIAVKDLFVPERRALALASTRGGYQHPGAAINRGALFGIPIIGAAGIPLSPASIGAAEGAYEHFIAAMGKRLNSATSAYDSAVASMEGRLLPQLRKVEGLGIAPGKEIKPPEPIEITVREITAPELREAETPVLD